MLEIFCAYIMMERKRVRFSTLAKATGYSEQGIIKAALSFIRIHKGDDYLEGGYLIEVYVPAVGLTSNFIQPMQTAWQNIRHPIGQIRDKVVAFIGAFAQHSEVKLTDVELNKRTGHPVLRFHRRESSTMRYSTSTSTDGKLYRQPDSLLVSWT